MKINSNIQALVAQNVLRSNEEKHAASTERLSSGFKINHAKDSPAGMAIGNRMNAQIRSLYKAKDNANNAVNVVQTADGALTEVHNMLQRMNELAIKASTGTLTSSDREAIQLEVDGLRDEINRVAKDTEYNTQNLLGGEQGMKGYVDTINNHNMKVTVYDPDFPQGKYKLTMTAGSDPKLTYTDGLPVPNLKEPLELDKENGFITATMIDGSKIEISYDGGDISQEVEINLTGIGGMKIQVGTATGQEIQVVIPSMDPQALGLAKKYNSLGEETEDPLKMTTQDDARKSIERINKAIEYISSARSRLGAYQNRLESTVTSLAETVENLEGSYSTVKDVDMAEEMVDYTKLQVLVQAGTSMLSQANEQPQQALQLLQ